MKRSKIKSIYHWSLMFLIMGMPLILTAISYIPNAYNNNNVIEIDIPKSETIEKQYETNEIYNESDIKVGNVYLFNGGTDISTSHVWYVDFDIQAERLYLLNGNLYDINENLLYEDVSGCYFIMESYADYNEIDIQEADETFTYYETTETSKQLVVNNGAYQVYEFNKHFIESPLNAWYKELLNITHLMPTTYTPINNILFMPLYGLYVLLFDLCFDVFAVIPNIFHSLFNKLGGNDE